MCSTNGIQWDFRPKMVKHFQKLPIELSAFFVVVLFSIWCFLSAVILKWITCINITKLTWQLLINYRQLYNWIAFKHSSRSFFFFFTVSGGNVLLLLLLLNERAKDEYILFRKQTTTILPGINAYFMCNFIAHIFFKASDWLNWLLRFSVIFARSLCYFIS